MNEKMEEKSVLFQHSTLVALMAGLYKGTLSFGELLEHGDFGLGTIDGLDGEMIVLDGKAFLFKGDKTVREIGAEEQLPYAAVNYPNFTNSFTQNEPIADKQLLKELEQKLLSKNLFHSIKMHGTFSKMHVRTIDAAKEGEPFVEVAARQPEFNGENLTGTIVGFWTPELFSGVSLEGYHLHFLTDDQQFGGHVLDFEMENGLIEFGAIDQIVQDFPKTSENFLKTDFDLEKMKRDIAASE